MYDLMMMKEFFVMKLNRLNIGFCFLNFVNCFFFVKKKNWICFIKFFYNWNWKKVKSNLKFVFFKEIVCGKNNL